MAFWMHQPSDCCTPMLPRACPMPPAGSAMLSAGFCNSWLPAVGGRGSPAEAAAMPGGRSAGVRVYS